MGLGGRLAAAFAGLVAVTALLIGGASVLTTERQVTGEVDTFLRDRASEIADGQRARPDGRSGRGSRDDATIEFVVEPDAEVQLLAEDGSVTATSGLALPVSATDIDLADRDDGAVLRTVTLDDTDYRMITVHISGGGAVQVARSLDEASGLLGVLQTRLLLIAGGMAAIGAGVGWALAQRTTRPLRRLTRTVESVAATGDLTVPIDADGNDEVARLARGFDHMLAALNLSREQQHRLVQDAAHELRTPFTSIKANIDWLSHADHLDPATRTQTLTGVQHELGELNDLIDEIVDLATDRHELPPFERIDLAAVARDAVDQFGLRADRAVRFDALPCVVDGDPHALQRAITNLLTNANRYSPPGAPVSVDVSTGGVWVSDRGGGIPPEERDRVFDRFYRRPEDRSGPGSGLGLSIVASIVDAHDGAVEIGEADGGGTRIGFRLPVATAS